MWLAVPERVMMKSPVRENRPPGSVRGAPGNRRPYRDPVPILPWEAGKGRSPIFPSKNAGRKNRRKFLRRNGQRGYDGIPPEY
jgi:hypothetical protein